MSQKLIDKQAPDFRLNDANGKPVSLSDYRGKKNVVLVFNRGLY
jgi:mycoredoxin-dependent peroxiredoxin